MQFTPLPSRGLIALSGADVPEFLQGLISNDVRKLEQGPIYAALLSPQGKYVHDFFLMRVNDSILIDCEKTRMSDLVQRLSLYKLRSKVEIKSLPESDGVIAAWGGGAAIGFVDPRLPELGYRIIGNIAEGTAQCRKLGWSEGSPREYDRMRLALGVPDGSRDMIVDKSFLLEWGFEQLHGVDFNKGCYVGQEVTARSKFRGQVRKTVYKVRGKGELPEAGTPIMSGEKSIGEMRSHAGEIGLALLRIDDMENAADLWADDLAITAERAFDDVNS